MMGSKGASDGADFIGGVIFVVIVLIALIPKEVWIGFGVIVAVVLVGCVVGAAVTAVRKRQANQAAAAEQEREQRVRDEKQRRLDRLGKQNAALVEAALSDVQKVTASEAARAGWLGDIDFSADIKEITDNFEKAHALRAVTGKLSALTKPSADDRKLLAEARSTIANLERAATERVELIGKCAIEAQQVDKSLRTEREDARVAEQRAELHAKLSAMLYGIEATPAAAPADSAVAAVLARVQAYREIKNQIQKSRNSGSG